MCCEIDVWYVAATVKGFLQTTARISGSQNLNELLLHFSYCDGVVQLWILRNFRVVSTQFRRLAQ